MRVAWILMVLLGAAFLIERAPGNPFGIFGDRSAFSPEITPTKPFSDLPLEDVTDWLDDALAASKTDNTIKADETYVTKYVRAKSRGVATSLAELAAFPSVIIGRILAAERAAQKPGNEVIESAFLAQNALAALAQRVHEHRVRHFLIHDWPGTDFAATSGAYSGTSGTVAAQSYNVLLTSVPGAVENSGANTPQPGGPVLGGFDDIACDFSDFHDPECAGTEDIFGRVPQSFTPDLPEPLATATQASADGQANEPILPGGGSFAPIGGGGGGGTAAVNGPTDGLGGGSSEPTGSEDGTLSPTAVPLPGALGFALAGFGALALFRRRKPS